MGGSAHVGSLSICLKCFSSQEVQAATSSFRLWRCSFYTQINDQVQTARSGQMKTHLDPALFPTSTLEIALPNPLRNCAPKSPALPFVLLVNGFDSNLFLWRRNIVERHPIRSLRVGVPCSFDDLRVVRGSRRLQGRFEGVRLSREVAFALVFDLNAQRAF